MKITNFSELNTFLRQFKAGSLSDGSVYTLDRIKQLMPVVGSPQEKMQIIHVAGTSGKTSTCYYVAEMLRIAGAKVGLTVSPHVFEINERVQINGDPMGEATICELFSEFIAINGVLELKPTYFELVVAFAYWAFYKQGCTHAVVEVGLGGLLDGTNVVQNKNKVSVITDIGLDHMAVLGNTVEKIASQKVGIIQPDNHVFSYQQDERVNEVIDARVAKQRATMHRFDQPELENGVKFLEDLPFYQKRNWLLARAISEYVIERDKLEPLNKEALYATQRVNLPARMQRIQLRDKLLILDGAHNPQKLSAFVYSLTAMYPGWRAAVLTGFVESKRETLLESLRLIKNISNNIIATEFSVDMDLPHKVIPAQELGHYCDQAGFKHIRTLPDQKRAFELLLEQPEDIIVVTGSFYLIGSLWPVIKEYM